MRLLNYKQNFYCLIFLLILILVIETTNSFADNAVNNNSVSKSTSQSISTLTTEEIDWIKQHPNIKVALNHGWAPIEFVSENNELRGISVDYLNRLEIILGLKFVKINAEESPSIEKADMISAIANIRSLTYSRFVALNEPYLTMPVVIFTRADNDDIHNLKDLENKKVAVFKAGVTTQLLVQQHPEINFYRVDIAEEGLNALVSKKVDAYIGNIIIVNYIANTTGIRSIKIVGRTPYTASIRMAVRNDWPLLKSILQKGLKAIDAEQQKSIVNNWSGFGNQKIYDFFIYAIVIILIIVIFILIVRSWKQSKDIKQRDAFTQHQIWQQANFDSLTQLPNRHMFRDRLNEELKKTDRSNLPLALFFLDLDHFKQVNDSLGHEMGDKLLIQAAKRLTTCVRNTDTVARLGGDEFTIILSSLLDVTDVERVNQELLKKMAEPFYLNDEMVHISTSIGITLYPRDGTDVDALLKNADQAMYAAKSLGRNCSNYYSESLQDALNKRLYITSNLRLALTEQQFHLLYQPIVDLATQNIYKAEALIRWQHPIDGLIDPNQFITIAEETGLIIPIGNWVFSEALKQVNQWRQSIHVDFQISVNTSPVQFKDEAGLKALIDYLEKYELLKNSIIIEITEGLVLETKSEVKRQLSEFRHAGIQIAIDDFGTGYSSLAYLKKFDVDFIKIDRSFVANIKDNSDEMVLCKAIIVMAHTLGLKVIAEGVETAEQEKLLIEAGCDYGQGYFYSKPLSSADFEFYLSKR